MESCLGFLQLLFCGTVRQKGTSGKTKRKDSSEERERKVKIRVGFEGKDTLFSTENLNVKTTFGQYAVLLEYASNKLVPLHSSGNVMEPLEAKRRYVVVLNTHGSSSHKWEDLRRSGGITTTSVKKHRKHGSGKHSSKKKRSSSSGGKSPSKASSMHERKTAEEVKEPLLVEKEEEEDVEDDSEEEAEEPKEKEEHPVTNFATIDFGVSSSMDSMISNSREVYVY